MQIVRQQVLVQRGLQYIIYVIVALLQGWLQYNTSLIIWSLWSTYLFLDFPFSHFVNIF